MFRAFNVKSLPPDLDRFERIGTDAADAESKRIAQTIAAFLEDGGSLDGTKMQENWFPQVGADVFISHSKKDLPCARRVAGWLQQKFGLRAFIDSSVWGNAADLLREVDDEWCWNKDAPISSYSYEKRNRSTSHVHMMLATALSMMINKTECAWVLSTANAITTEDVIERTSSPWIYLEIATMNLVQRRSPEEHRGLLKKAEVMDEVLRARRGFDFYYDVSLQLRGMRDIDADVLMQWEEWRETRLQARAGTVLDQLYQLAPLKAGVDVESA